VADVNGFRTILFERDGPVASITLNRPQVLNAYNTEMRDDLHGALSTIRVDRSVRAVVLQGNGRAFCSGGDIREFGSAPSPIVAREVRWQRDVWGLLRSLRPPTIAAIHGHAAGSGLEMALLCDFRIAARGALLSLPETGLAMIPGVVGTQTLPRAVGVARALDLVLTGRVIDARLALRIGMVGSVVAPGRLRIEAARLARRLAKIDEELVSRVKTLVARGVDFPLATALDRERILGKRPKA
jgi:enoyl-CoA hydratase/carnithine racemase